MEAIEETRLLLVQLPVVVLVLQRFAVQHGEPD